MDRPIHVDRDPATGAATVADNKISMPQSGPSWAQQMLGYPDVTGTLPAEKQAEKNIERVGGTRQKPDKQPDGRVVELPRQAAPSPSERAILERLQERRQELESRDREIDLRESLLHAAEKKFETHANELRDLEIGRRRRAAAQARRPRPSASKISSPCMRT